MHIDLGTGDGSYALHVARSNLDMAVIGIDTCLDNLTKATRKGMPNLRFLAGDATAPPTWLHRTATRVSINFPYGSLLRALMAGDENSRKLFAIARPGTRIEIRVNGSAANKLGMPTHVVEARLQHMLRATGAGTASTTVEPHAAFRRFPSEWAKRLAYGRPSGVVVATAEMGSEQSGREI